MGPNGAEDHDAYETRLNSLEIATWVNFFMVFVVGALWCAYTHWCLHQQMMRNPLKLHMTETHSKPLDSNELGMIFRVFDKNTDVKIDRIISVPTVVTYVLENAGQQKVLDRCSDITAAVLAKIPAKRSMINEEEFFVHYKPIMVEITHWYNYIVFEDVNLLPQHAIDNNDQATGTKPKAGVSMFI